MHPRALPLALIALISLSLVGCATSRVETRPSPPLPPASAPAASTPAPAPAPAVSAADASAAAPVGTTDEDELKIDASIPELIAFLEQQPAGPEATIAQQRLRERIGARLIRQAGGKGNIRPAKDFPLDAFDTDDLIAGFGDVGVGFRLIGHIKGQKGSKSGYTYIDSPDAWQRLHAGHVVSQASASSSRLLYDIRMLRIRREVRSSIENGTSATFYRDAAYTTQTVLRLGLTRYYKKGKPNGERRTMGGLGAAVVKRHGRTTVYAFDLADQSLIPR
ncbi:hypothetical protein [Denitromonas ohlonensis]|uniref:hypothetical protein n=1 Tax=Denitromonas ohlonensis TaxID=3078508 RepID=UPI001642EB68|nr:hypothetical protein [Denitromonas ohlonensis]